MIDGFANVVEEAACTSDRWIGAKFFGKHASDMCHFD